MLKQFILNRLWKNKTDLCNMMEKEGSDKSTGHNYSTVYKYLFEPLRNEKLNFLEVGLGTNNIDVDSNMGKDGTPLASMRAWRSYFPNAELHGADIDKRILKDEHRIKTHFIDQLDLDVITNFKNEFDTGYKFDIIIDDGLHTAEANLNLFTYLNDILRVNGYYIIEDCNLEDYNDILASIDTCNFEIASLQIPHHNKHDNRMIILKKTHDRLLFENELTIEYLNSLTDNDFEKYLTYDEYKINHTKQKVFSMSLFNQKVDLNTPQDQEKEYWENKYLNKLLKLIPIINETDYGINLFCEERYKDLIDDKNVNVYTFKHSVGAVGMFWRFLSIDMVEETIICDIDIDNINIHKVMMSYPYNCRYVASGKNTFYVDREQTAKKYSSFLCSQLKFLKKDFDFSVREIMIKFLNHQEYHQDKERKTIYNYPVGHFKNGFGNNTLNYGCDERFMAKVIYFYLMKKSRVLTVYEDHNNYENKEDIDFSLRNNNKLMIL